MMEKKRNIVEWAMHYRHIVILITTVLFAIEHDTWLAGAIAGIAYNLLYMRSGNLWVPILSHAVTNCLLGIWIIYAGAWHLW